MSDDSEDKRSSAAAVGRMVFDAVLAIVVAATGYYVTGIATDLKGLRDEDTKIRAEAASFREQVARDNVRKDEYRTDIAEVKRLLERIEAKVDRKVDRAESTARVGPTSWRDGRDVNR